LGVVMVATFAHSLRASVTALHLDPTVVRDLESNVARLGGLDAPAGLAPQITTEIRGAVTRSFLFGFRIIMLVCASLALASATVAWRMIPARGAEAG
jgi:hypothetical protein